MNSPLSVLLVDDDPSLLEVTTLQLEAAGFTVTSCENGTKAIAIYEITPTDVVVTDLKMPGLGGMEVLQTLLRLDPDAAVLVVTAFGSVDTAVTAMRHGAHDYVTKPVARDALALKVRRAAEHRRMLLENRTLRSRVGSAGRPLLVASDRMQQLLAQAARFATADLPVLITGESGTGKELVAREVHRLSNRADGPFVAVNCAAIPGDLLEAELFGHSKGAFTGASRAREGHFRAAHGGTLLLDEIGDLPMGLQPKLLRVLQERVVQPLGGGSAVPVDVRIVASTHRDLTARVRAGSFREDLYYRLAVLPLTVPSLRHRAAEIVPLFEFFLRSQSELAGRVLRLSSEVESELRARPWPGNVRELENVARRVALLTSGPVVTLADLPAGRPADGLPTSAGARALTVRMDDDEWELHLPKGHLSLPRLERRLVEEVIRMHGGNKSAAARYLGIPRHVLLYRIEKYEIDADDLTP